MNYHVGDVGALRADALLDVARARVGCVEAARAVEAEREERDEPGVRAQEAQLTRLLAERLPHDAPHDLGGVGLHLAARAGLRQRLEMALDAADLGDRRLDRRLERL